MPVDAVTRYLNSRVKNLETATTAVLREVGAEFATAVRGQLRSRFKRRVGGAKVKQLKPRGDLGPATVVSIKPHFLQVFETPQTITAKSKFLVIPTEHAKKFRLGRVGKGGLQRALAPYKGTYRIATKGDSKVILLRDRAGTWLPVYVLTRQVQTPKRLNIKEEAQRIGATIDERIGRFVSDG
jgi:hypothetical protein